MFLNLYSLSEVEQLFKFALSDPKITLNPDKKALYHVKVKYEDLISLVRENYHRATFLNNLTDFILSQKKPILNIVEEKEDGILMAYSAELQEPYSMSYGEIANFLNKEVQVVIDSLSFIPMEVTPFSTNIIPNTLQQLLVEEFKKITLRYYEFLAIKEIDSFFAANPLSFKDELFVQWLDLLYLPCFEIDLDSDMFQVLKIEQIVKVK